MQEGMVLPACVKSVEDHGYLLTLGLSKATGFLPRGAAGSAELKEGQLVDTIGAYISFYIRCSLLYIIYGGLCRGRRDRERERGESSGGWVDA